jgi:hypothetical protein
MWALQDDMVPGDSRPTPEDPSNGRIRGLPRFAHSRRTGRAHDPDKSMRFLDEGKPPIAFTMVTTIVAVMGGFHGHAAEACHRLGRRGLLLTGWAGNVLRRRPPGLRAFACAPILDRVASRPRDCASHCPPSGRADDVFRSDTLLPAGYSASPDRRCMGRAIVVCPVEQGSRA